MEYLGFRHPIWSQRPLCMCFQTYSCITENLNFLNRITLKDSTQFSSVAQLCLAFCNPMNRSTPGLPVHYQLPESTQTYAHRVGDAIQPSLSSPSPPAPNPSQHQGLFQWSTLHMRWPKYWSFSFSISPSNEHPGLISFRVDWLDLLAVQGTALVVLKTVSTN